MSFGLEVFTGSKKIRYSTEDTSAIPPKVLFFREYLNFNEGNSGTVSIDIGTDVGRVEYAFFTLRNNDYLGHIGNGSSTFGALPSISAEIDHAASVDTILVVHLTLSDGNWRSVSQKDLDCLLWVMGR